MTRTDPEVELIWWKFHRLVNMTSPELRDWLILTTDGADTYAPRPGVDVHALGGRVLQILDKRRVDLTESDLAAMGEITDLIAELLANPPNEDATNDPWRHSLLTLGHDPLRPNSLRGIDADGVLQRE